MGRSVHSIKARPAAQTVLTTRPPRPATENWFSPGISLLSGRSGHAGGGAKKMAGTIVGRSSSDQKYRCMCASSVRILLSQNSVRRISLWKTPKTILPTPLFTSWKNVWLQPRKFSQHAMERTENTRVGTTEKRLRTTPLDDYGPKNIKTSRREQNDRMCVHSQPRWP